MKCYIDNSKKVEVKEVTKITVIISDNIEIRISTNSQNELVINKMDFRDGENITIKPAGGNEIRVS